MPIMISDAFTAPLMALVLLFVLLPAVQIPSSPLGLTNAIFFSGLKVYVNQITLDIGDQPKPIMHYNAL